MWSGPEPSAGLPTAEAAHARMQAALGYAATAQPVRGATREDR
jgi:hypothetical protein